MMSKIDHKFVEAMVDNSNEIDFGVRKVSQNYE